MRALVVTLLLVNTAATCARADMAAPVAAPDLAPVAAPAPGSEPVLADVTLDEVEEATAYRRSAWLLLLPLLCALAFAWNVDWKDARVSSAIAEARARRAPRNSGGPS